MIYTIKKGNPQLAPLLLLHGTGGDENSLLELGRLLAPEATLISLRGTINEGGANRFFKRYGEGQFDLDDLEKQTDLLLTTLTNISEQEQVDLKELVIVGYSNGANIGAHLLLERESPYRRGIFFHGMSLGRHLKHHDLALTKIWFSKGKSDPIVSEAAALALVTAFEKRQAEVTTFWLPSGHQLVYAEVEAAKAWLDAGGSV